MSYAQVAQHHKDALKEKKDKQAEVNAPAATTRNNTSTTNHNTLNNTSNGRTAKEDKEYRGELLFVNWSIF